MFLEIMIILDIILEMFLKRFVNRIEMLEMWVRLWKKRRNLISC